MERTNKEEDFKVGTVFVGNVNNVKMKILKICDSDVHGTVGGYFCKVPPYAIIERFDLNANFERYNPFRAYINQLSHCDLTILN